MNMNLNIHQESAKYQHTLMTAVANAIHRTHANGSPFRRTAMDIYMSNESVKRQTTIHLLNRMEYCLLNGTFNPNAMENYDQLVEVFVNMYVPYCMYNMVYNSQATLSHYIARFGLPTVLDPNTQARMQNDATNYHNTTTHEYNTLVNHYSMLEKKRNDMFHAQYTNNNNGGNRWETIGQPSIPNMHMGAGMGHHVQPNPFPNPMYAPQGNQMMGGIQPPMNPATLTANNSVQMAQLANNVFNQIANNVLSQDTFNLSSGNSITGYPQQAPVYVQDTYYEAKRKQAEERRKQEEQEQLRQMEEQRRQHEAYNRQMEEYNRQQLELRRQAQESSSDSFLTETNTPNEIANAMFVDYGKDGKIRAWTPPEKKVKEDPHAGIDEVIDHFLECRDDGVFENSDDPYGEINTRLKMKQQQQFNTYNTPTAPVHPVPPVGMPNDMVVGYNPPSVPVLPEIRDNANPNEMETVVRHRRKRGTNWFAYSTTHHDDIIGDITNEYDMLRSPDKFINWRKIHAPSELFPVDSSDLIWENQVAFVVHTYPDGQSYKEYIYTNNKDNPAWKLWNTSEFKCVIELNDKFNPVQKFIPLTEGEKMDIEAHKIPGQVSTHVVTQAIPHFNEKIKPLNKVADNMLLSVEELKEQEAVLSTRGEQLDDFIPEVLEGEITVENLTILPAQMQKEVVIDFPTRKVVTSRVFVTNDTYTVKGQMGAPKKITEVFTECETFDELKERVFDPLLKDRELTLYHKLSVQLDTQYNKLLAKLGILDCDVTDVIQCYKDAISMNIIPEDQRNIYDTYVADMLRNFFSDSCETYYDEEKDQHIAILGYEANVVYVDRKMSDLNFEVRQEEGQVSDWYQLAYVNEAGHQSDFFHVCRNALLNSDREQVRDTYILTKDGKLMEVMFKNYMNNFNILINYRKVYDYR